MSDLETAIKAVQIFSEMHPRPSHVTQKQAAEMLDVSEATVSRLVKARALTLNHFGRIPIRQVDAALAARAAA